VGNNNNNNNAYLVVPLFDGQRMGDGKPVAVDLKVCRLTKRGQRGRMVKRADRTAYYAGSNRSFKAVAKTAHWPKDGNRSIATFADMAGSGCWRPALSRGVVKLIQK
jgi:hypothetical protein